MSFCVKCGDDCDNTINGLCISCFLDGRKLTTLPHHVDLQVCANCGEFFVHNNWVKRETHEAIMDAAVDQLSVIKEAKVASLGTTYVEQETRTFVVTVESELDIEGCIAEDVSSTIVRVKNTVCKRCSRQLGSYYEAILQIRSASKDLPEALRQEALAMVENYVDRVSRTNRQLFITKMEIVTGGVDVYLSSISLGKSLAKELSDAYCAETKEAPKLVGQTSDGQDMFRLTYLVRLPDYHVGDVVVFEDKYYKVVRVSSVGGKFMDLMDFRERSVRRSDMPSVKVYEKESDMREATVISNSGDEIQIMHPSNYKTIDLRVPEGSEIGDSVKVVDIDDTLYYVPDVIKKE